MMVAPAKQNSVSFVDCPQIHITCIYLKFIFEVNFCKIYSFRIFFSEMSKSNFPEMKGVEFFDVEG